MEQKWDVLVMAAVAVRVHVIALVQGRVKQLVLVRAMALASGVVRVLVKELVATTLAKVMLTDKLSWLKELVFADSLSRLV